MQFRSNFGKRNSSELLKKVIVIAIATVLSLSLLNQFSSRGFAAPTDSTLNPTAAFYFTPSLSNFSTPTPSPTSTPTPIPTSTPNSTSTPSPTPTPTTTPSPTNSSSTPTPTLTPSPSPSPTNSTMPSNSSALTPSTNPNSTSLIQVSVPWNPIKNSYNAENPPSTWAPGNCYGFSSTAVLYYMHYTAGDSSYPYYPLQTSPAQHTSDLTLPIPGFFSRLFGYHTVTKLNNPFLAITFHQVFDPNQFSVNANWGTDIMDEKKQLYYLIDNLTNGYPVVLDVGDSIAAHHAIVGVGVNQLNTTSFQIEVYDPNYPKSVQLANLDTVSGVLSFPAEPSYDHFTVVIPTIKNEAGRESLFGESDWCDNWIQNSVIGYDIVISDKMVTVEGNNTFDYFITQGNSQTFVCGIPGSYAIEEGGLQVYAIPSQVSYQIVDPTTEQSTILVTRLDNESGQLVGHGYLLNVKATAGSLNYTVTPSQSGLLLTTKDSGLSANVTLFSASSQSHTIFQASSLPINQEQTANISAINWQNLNSTSQTSVTMQISNSNTNQPTQATMYSLTNGQQGLSPLDQTGIANTQNGETQILIIAGISATFVCLISPVIYVKRKKERATGQ